MKIIHSSIIRSLIAIVSGGLMIQYRETMVQWLTVGIGSLFFVSGVISLTLYFVQRSRLSEQSEVVSPGGAGGGAAFPIVGLGSVLLGVVLICMPTTFAAYLTYVFAAMLILGAIGQFANLALMLRVRPLHWAFWVLPVAVFGLGCASLVNPTMIVSAPFLLLGVVMIVYGVSELINSFQINRVRKKVTEPRIFNHDIEDAEILEDSAPEQ